MQMQKLTEAVKGLNADRIYLASRGYGRQAGFTGWKRGCGIGKPWADAGKQQRWQRTPLKCILLKTEKKLMNETAVLQKVEVLTKAVERLQERVEDLEDMRDLQAAIAENASKPLIPWEQVKSELELD
jgi:hypothetical protein